MYAGFSLRQRIYQSFDTRYDPYASIRAGIFWKATEALDFSIEWSKTLLTPTALALSMAYHLSKRLTICAGWRLKPVRIFMGMSFSLTRMILDYSVAIDPLLGIIHALSFRFNKENEP
jgi:hypothetical protein